ncbi:MAG TPA: tetratricopeptide repeat protein [Thermomicrobiales bacterium]|nr:tetratricopeptide repeat protein [Thermomicrobiales bacterium]
MSTWMERFAGKGRRGGNGVLVQIAREVVGRKRSLQGAISEVRHPAVLDALSDEEFTVLSEIIEERVKSDREFATVLARLAHAAAHAKGFDRETVDAALALDALLPADDPARDREKLLRDAYRAAQRAGYVQGGRRALARLGQRAAQVGEPERARVLLQQQLDLGPDTSDTEDEVDAAIVLGDLLHRDGDTDGALELFQRAAGSAGKLRYAKGLSEALVREIDLSRGRTSDQRLISLQERALGAARDTGDSALAAHLLIDLAEPKARGDDLAGAVKHLEEALDLARDLGDMEMENQALEMLSVAERQLGRNEKAISRDADRVRIGTATGAPTAARDAIEHGAQLLELHRADEARQVLERALDMAEQRQDNELIQRAHGGVGIALTQLQRPAEALDHLATALEMARQNGEAKHEAQWLAAIGEALWHYDQPGEASKALQQGITVARREGEQGIEAGILMLLGDIFGAQREFPEARAAFETALERFVARDDVESQIAALSSLGGLAVEARRTEAAMRYYQQALQLAEESRDQVAAVRLYGRMARVAQRVGEPQAAIDALEQAVALADELDDVELLGTMYQRLAIAMDTAGHSDTLDTYEQALSLAREVDDVYGEAMMLVNIGSRLHNEGEDQEAVEVLEHALALADQLGASGLHLRQRGEAVLAGIEQGSAPAPRSRGSRPLRPEEPAPPHRDDAGYSTPIRAREYNGSAASSR